MLKKIYVLFFVAVSVFFTFSQTVFSATKKESKDDLYKQVSVFSDALAIVQSEYVDEIKSKDLIYGALKGMLSSLDPHSQFMDPDTYNELKVDTEGKFGGLGIEITIDNGLLTVITPIEDTPAWNAGIKAGDRIVKINNEVTRDITITDAVKRLRGKPGESVSITVFRESEKKIIEFKVVRDMIKIKDIKEARILDSGVGYIRLVEFRDNTAHDFGIATDSLIRQGMRALVLDLRNNPGGLLDAAVKVAEKFVPKGKIIVYTQGRQSDQNITMTASSNRPINQMPMVVLINEGSASGSEIVAGCLQDYKRAIVVGVKSYGKGSVQTVIPLNDGSALRLTTSKYFTPFGKVIHGKGVVPDIVVEQTKSEQLIATDKSADVFEQVEQKETDRNKKTDKEFDYKQDAQLVRSVDILKAITLYQGTASDAAQEKH